MLFHLERDNQHLAMITSRRADAGGTLCHSSAIAPLATVKERAMADWVKCTRHGSEEAIFINLDHADKIELYQPKKNGAPGTVIRFSQEHTVVVKEPIDSLIRKSHTRDV
jgi:hypothetical protein